MSYIEIFVFDKEGNSEIYAEVKNAWGGSMAIWNTLGENTAVMVRQYLTFHR